MPNTYLKANSIAANQYFKLEKDSNNNSIKRNVNAGSVGPRRQGTSFGHTHNYQHSQHSNANTAGNIGGVSGTVGGAHSNEKVANVFERLSRTPNRNLRKPEAVEKPKVPLRQSSVHNKRIPLIPLDKSVTHGAGGGAGGGIGVGGGAGTGLKDKIVVKRANVQIKSPKKKSEVNPYLNRKLTKSAANASESVKSVSFTRSPKLFNAENLDYLIPVPRNSRTPTRVSKKSPVAKKSQGKIKETPQHLGHATKEKDVSYNLTKGPNLSSPMKQTPKAFVRPEEAFLRFQSPPVPASSPEMVSPRLMQRSSHSKSPFTENIAAHTSETFSRIVSPQVDSATSVSIPMTPNNPISSEMSLDSNIISENVQDILARKQAEMSQSEIQLLKEVVKGDRRAGQLRADDSIVFKDILKSQLKDILKQEEVVATALCSMDKSLPKRFSGPFKGVRIPKAPPLEMASYMEQVPFLEKEIMLLRTLGKRLESKLLTNDVNKISVGTSVTDLRSHLKRSWGYVLSLPKRHYVQYNAVSTGLLFVVGMVQEFLIAKKTLLELKQEAEKAFYVPQQCQLKCTNFEELKQHPEVLKRYLQPKNPGQGFNILDHDPGLFRDSFLQSDRVPPANESEDLENLYYLKTPKPLRESSDVVSNSLGYLKNKQLNLKKYSNEVIQIFDKKEAMDFLTEAMAGRTASTTVQTVTVEQMPPIQMKKDLKLEEEQLASQVLATVKTPPEHTVPDEVAVPDEIPVPDEVPTVPEETEVSPEQMFENVPIEDFCEKDEDLLLKTEEIFDAAAAMSPSSLDESLIDLAAVKAIQSLIKADDAVGNLTGTAVARKHSRRKSQRKVAPLPPDAERIGPKNTLIRISILATVQLTMLFIVAAAFAFPDWTCK